MNVTTTRAAKTKRRHNVIFVRRAPRLKTRAILQFGPVRLPAAIGRSGTTVFKREGDGATPVAAMRLLHGFLRGDRIGLPPTGLSLRRIRPDMLWCDAPAHPSYNRLVRAPFAGGHEQMRRDDGLYDICIVLDWNVASRARHRGSAIFLHLNRPGYQPTAGCVALCLRDMRRILPYLRKGTVLRVL